MRLSEYERNSIKETILAFDSNAEIFLFGSRVDDNKKGGDIDLLIFSKTISFSDKIKLKLRLYDLIGEQKIDLILAKDCNEPFTRIAKGEGILL